MRESKKNGEKEKEENKGWKIQRKDGDEGAARKRGRNY